MVVYCVRIATPPCSIAVLPFEDLTAHPDSGPFVSGLTEDLVADLAKLPDVTVVAVPQLAGGSSADAIVSQKARQQLGARYLLEGNVRQVEDPVRITAPLVEVATGHHGWGERYDRLLGDIFAVQDDVVESIIVGVQAALALGDRTMTSRIAREPSRASVRGVLVLLLVGLCCAMAPGAVGVWHTTSS